MSLCCICMLCKKEQNSQNRNQDELPALHEPPDEMERLETTVESGEEYADMAELVKPGTPPPLYRSLIRNDSSPGNDSSTEMNNRKHVIKPRIPSCPDHI
jgi:hypothetical protein